MKTFCVLCVFMGTVAAFGAIIVQSASAETLTFELALYLINAAVPANGTVLLEEDEFLWEDVIFGIAFKCSWHIEGETEEEGNGFLVVDVLNLAGTQSFSSGKELTTEGLLCGTEKGCAANADLEVFPLNFPWLFEAMLDIQTKEPWELLRIHTGAPAAASHEWKCLVGGLPVEETCTAEDGTGFAAKNVASGVELLEKAAEPNANCTTGGNSAGVIEPLAGGLLSSPAGTVSISTPPE